MKEIKDMTDLELRKSSGIENQMFVACEEDRPELIEMERRDDHLSLLDPDEALLKAWEFELSADGGSDREK